MAETRYRGRRATSIENELVRVTVLHEGGHIAEILDKQSGVNPLWTPPWESIEPSTYDPRKHPEYGADAESKLLSGIMGHNLCMDIFGGPSAEEAAAGLTVHGEASVAAYEVTAADGELTVERARLPQAQLRVERRYGWPNESWRLPRRWTNEAITDRPIAWTEHVTLGPPFLEKGATEFRAPVTKSLVLEEGNGDLELLHGRAGLGWIHHHLMDPSRETAFFVAWSPRSQVAFGYVMAARGFPLAGRLGGELQPHRRSVEWADSHPRHGIRRFTRGRDAAADDRARQPVWRARVPVDSGAHPRGGAVPRAIQGGLERCPAELGPAAAGEVRFEY
jgi:hypothetical protein